LSKATPSGSWWTQLAAAVSEPVAEIHPTLAAAACSSEMRPFAGASPARYLPVSTPPASGIEHHDTDAVGLRCGEQFRLDLAEVVVTRLYRVETHGVGVWGAVERKSHLSPDVGRIA
jgi:hypothetical protein